MEVAATVGIFCASVPALKPLVRKYTPAALGLQTNANNNTPSCVQRTATVVATQAARGAAEDVERFPGPLDMDMDLDLDLGEWHIAKFPSSQRQLIVGEEVLEDTERAEGR